MEEELSKTEHEAKGENIPYSWIARKEGFIARNCNNFNNYIPTKSNTHHSSPKYISMLGHSMKAVALSKGSALSYNFTSEHEDSALLRIALIPTHPHDNGDLRYAVSIDGNDEKVVSIKEPYRSAQWKKNVLRGQAVKNICIKLTKGEHTLTIRALDEGIILDQWMIDFNRHRKHYLFPID